MTDPYQLLDQVVQDLEKLRRTVRKGKSRQVAAKEETTIVRANCLAWFNNYRPLLSETIDEELVKSIDSQYKELLAASDKSTMRTRYDGLLKELKLGLNGLKQYAIDSPREASNTNDLPPNFSSLVPDARMREVLNRRWTECANCIVADAPLAATVMMGGLVEAILLARILQASDKSPILSAQTAPKHARTGKTVPLNEWTLRNYIDVAHELNWISQSARDVGEVVRDYRNYVHPHKELSHGVILATADAALFWEISKAIVRQVLGNAGV